ncbi:MAG: respiratory nitrate reductase subunit gamma, partial [Acidimicrobiia bacterium]
MAVATQGADPESEAVAPARRRRPVLLVLGIIAGLGTLLLGFLGTLPEHQEPEIGRVVFGNVPLWLQAVFYVTTAGFIVVGAVLFQQRSESWMKGAAEDRTGLWRERLRQLSRGLRMTTLMRDRQAGLMHSMVYFGFLVLFAGTVTLELDHIAPNQLKFLEGGVYQVYSAILDAASLVYLGGLAWAFARRYLQRPWRLRSKTKPEDALILGLLALIGVTGLSTEAARIALGGQPDFEVWSFVGYPLSYLVPEGAAATAHLSSWLIHVASFLALLVVVPVTKLRHMVTSPANMFLSPHPRPKGAMREMPDLTVVEDIETIGASVVADFTWKQLFDTDACTICGRCTSVCPANITGKPLDPREIVLKVGEVAAATAGISPPVSLAEGIVIDGDSVLQRIRPEEVWSCTTCR